MTFLPHRHLHRQMPEKLDGDGYRHGSFISRELQGDKFICHLCDVESESPYESVLHSNESIHMYRGQQVVQMQKNPIATKCAILQLRLDELSDEVSVKDVQQKLFSILMNYQFKNIMHSEVVELFAQVESTIVALETTEPRCLLELAAWKAVCVANPVADTIPTSQINYHVWQEWTRTGWKATKTAKRDASEIGIIVRSVLPFVGLK